MSEHQDACPFWVQFAHEQVELLRRCIDENKWYLSQKAGHDVGRHAAEADFIRNHADRVAADFRQDFCQKRCAGRELCRLAALVGDLNRFWAEASPERKTQDRALSACLPLSPPTAALPEAAPVASAPASDPGETAQQQPQVSPAQA